MFTPSEEEEAFNDYCNYMAYEEEKLNQAYEEYKKSMLDIWQNNY